MNDINSLSQLPPITWKFVFDQGLPFLLQACETSHESHLQTRYVSVSGRSIVLKPSGTTVYAHKQVDESYKLQVGNQYVKFRGKSKILLTNELEKACSTTVHLVDANVMKINLRIKQKSLKTPDYGTFVSHNQKYSDYLSCYVDEALDFLVIPQAQLSLLPEIKQRDNHYCEREILSSLILENNSNESVEQTIELGEEKATTTSNAIRFDSQFGFSLEGKFGPENAGMSLNYNASTLVSIGSNIDRTSSSSERITTVVTVPPSSKIVIEKHRETTRYFVKATLQAQKLGVLGRPIDCRVYWVWHKTTVSTAVNHLDYGSKDRLDLIHAKIDSKLVDSDGNAEGLAIPNATSLSRTKKVGHQL